MPAALHQARFEHIGRGLAARFNSPVFQPHLTLVEDMPRSSAELAPLLEKLAVEARIFETEITEVSGSDLYYRSLYAAFQKSPELMLLKELSVGLFEKGDISSFMPHISLAYGVETTPDKASAIGEFNKEFAGMPVVFDRIAVVSSSQQTAIEEWAIVHDLQLSR